MSELLPYELPDPTPEEELELQIGGSADEAERVLRIARPMDGIVRVREWSSENWTQMSERELAAETLLNEIEEAARDRRRLSQELHRIRLWLAGSAS